MHEQNKERGIGSLIFSAMWLWGRSNPRQLFFFLRVAWFLWRANRCRLTVQKRIDGIIPTVLAISPTMRCNYNCQGCYSRGRPEIDELSTRELDDLFTEAEEMGVLTVAITGGEPLLRDDIPDLVARHRRLLFVLITNGSLVTSELTRRIGRSGNVILLVSIEGFPEDTDGRRRPGAHETALRALQVLHKAGLCFGFAATNTARNMDHLASDAFVEEMMKAGCLVGFFTEYVPCSSKPRYDWVLDEKSRAEFRQRVLTLRRQKPIILVQFPQDEYGEKNQCFAAGRASLHVNAQGGIEPCPFVPISCENIRQGGLLDACRSPFLQSIRRHPEYLQRNFFACSLFEHLQEIERLAQSITAQKHQAP